MLETEYSLTAIGFLHSPLKQPEEALMSSQSRTIPFHKERTRHVASSAICYTIEQKTLALKHLNGQLKRSL